MSNYKDLFQNYDALVFCYVRTTGADVYACQIIELAAVRFVIDREKGKILNGGQIDRKIKLLPGVHLPRKIADYLHLTEDSLEKNGLYEIDVADEFKKMLKASEKTLVIAHHGQMTFGFITHLFYRFGYTHFQDDFDLLDTKTVLADRKPGNGNLTAAFEAYGLKEKKTDGTGLGEVKKLAYVALKMDEERADLCRYINVFATPNPNGLHRNMALQKITYLPQTACESIRPEEEILPAKVV